MIIDEEEIDLAVQFQREADALLGDLLKAFAGRGMQLEDVPVYIHQLSVRLEAAQRAEYLGDGCFDIRPRSHPGYRGDATGYIGDRSIERLIDDILADASDRIEVWRSVLHIVNDEEDSDE